MTLQLPNRKRYATGFERARKARETWHRTACPPLYGHYPMLRRRQGAGNRYRPPV